MSLLILLIEDSFDLAATVVQYLELECMRCDHAASGEAGLNMVRENDYDVILLDIMLPRINGLEVCTALRKSGNDTPILMLTARDTIDDKVAGFSSGTDDYLVKPFDMAELIARINALAKRRSGQAKIIKALDLTMNLDSRQAMRGARKLNLTPTGWIILETLVRAFPSVVSREKLMQAVWGDDFPETNSFKVHLHKLRKEIHEESIIIHTVSGQGYVIKWE
jgi:DNA-binding response OmpR family regulator